MAWFEEVTGTPARRSSFAVASATRRLVQETKIVSTPGALARRTIPASIEATEMRAASRSSRRSKVAAAATSIPRARKLAMSEALISGA